MSRREELRYRNETDQDLREWPDPTPVALAVDYKPEPTIKEQIRAQVIQELSMRAAQGGHETFEEADDFSMDEEPDLVSLYEVELEGESDTPLPDRPKSPVADDKGAGKGKPKPAAPKGKEAPSAAPPEASGSKDTPEK